MRSAHPLEIGIALLLMFVIGAGAGVKVAESDPATKQIKADTEARQEKLAWFTGANCVRTTEGRNSPALDGEVNCQEVCDLLAQPRHRTKCGQGIISGFVHVDITQ